jgi:aryl-alcohol dehydrogenase-like predicted oxidoreductase/Pyruvate/2-oxoacid:ferredoxin oxidoreductase delta subunit
LSSSGNALRVNRLGQTGLDVTQLCFGVLPIGPNQLAVPVARGAEIVGQALDAGVNFVDTAQSYRTYDYIAPALAGRKDSIIVSSKSPASSYEDMKKAIAEALTALGVERIGIFHLHAARTTPEVFEQRAGALRCLVDAKRAGVIQAVGIATHSVTTTRAAAQRDDIDVVFPIINVRGLGILHGTRDEMVDAIRYAHSLGKGLYAMKVFGGGNLLSDMREALDFVLGIPELAAMAVGMVSSDEVAANVRIFSGLDEAPGAGGNVFRTKTMTVMSFCQGCGTCIDACPNLALSIVAGKAVLDRDLCLLCGYCAPVCPQFAIRVV